MLIIHCLDCTNPFYRFISTIIVFANLETTLPTRRSILLRAITEFTFFIWNVTRLKLTKIALSINFIRYSKLVFDITTGRTTSIEFTINRFTFVAPFSLRPPLFLVLHCNLPSLNLPKHPITPRKPNQYFARLTAFISSIKVATASSLF